MASIEFALIAVSSLQPILVGFLAFVGLGRQVSTRELAQSLATMHKKMSAYRFYECSTYARLVSVIRYSMPFFSIVVAYIIYDVDLVFFLSETVMLAKYGLVCYLILGFFFLCMIVGLWYDYNSVGFSWGVS